MSLGLSHLTLSASTKDQLEQVTAFYQALGFELVSKKEESIRWLKLTAPKGSFATDVVLQLRQVVVEAATTATEDIEDIDWTVKEPAFVLFHKDLKAVKDTLTAIGSVWHEESHQERILCLDPLHTRIAFTRTPTTPPTPLTSMSVPKKIGILTSGGDAPGMNACVRAVVRYGITKGCDVYAIYEGYQGLVDGGEFIRKMDWKSVRGWLHVGGTTIGTARCMPFKTREGRLKAAENLVQNGIDSLIVCGGDGSLTGADVFRSEWSGLVKELESAGRITSEQASTYSHLTIVGLVGSIDNDMASTDITIGAVTSLHRICESVDSISTTALSHSRAFVIEVMGRHCGWLALMAGIATGADFVFIPERPPTEDDWESAMCAVAQRHRHLGKRKTVIIVAEGALDKFLKPIKPENIKNVLTDRLGLDTRVTTLGHTQRGGSPVAADRNLATMQAVEAVEAVLRATPDMPSPMIGMTENKVTCTPLMKAVALTSEVARAIGEKNFARAMELRDPQFVEEFDAYNATTILDDRSLQIPTHQRLRIAILHIGAPAGGMNAATRTAVRYALNRGHTALGVSNGFSGLVRSSIKEMSWLDVDGWTSRGGSELGTNRAVPGVDVDLGMVAYQLQKNNIQALIFVGGFEAFKSLSVLEAARSKYPSFCIPIVLLPATISNNVPGTDFSLGSDTSLNAIVEACDTIVQSAQSSRRRVFVIEVQGGRTGYLAVEAGLAAGANTVYIPEEGITLARLQSDVRHLMALYDDDDPEKSEGRLVLRTEGVSKTYTTDVISNIIKEEGRGQFDSRTAVLGHTQQGGTPSPLDRIRGTRLAMRTIQFVEEHTRKALEKGFAAKSPVPIELTQETVSVAVVGMRGHKVTFSPVKELMLDTDITNRKPRSAWWYEHRPLVDLLSGRGHFDEEELQ
ncbi:6-phosphofructokinase [Spinellus fusiger]|nr:6-phosphofructokinase [Spinellus fusiger]